MTNISELFKKYAIVVRELDISIENINYQLAKDHGKILFGFDSSYSPNIFDIDVVLKNNL